jgi:hypothetical protein
MNASVSDFPIPEIGATADRAGADDLAESAAGEREVINLHRDDRDVQLLLRMSASEILIVLALLISLACNIWQYWRRPDRIVVDRTAGGDRVVMVNDNPIGAAVSFGPDRPGDEDKRRLANEWAAARYAIDPMAREQAVERMLRMMEPNAAAKFVAYLKRNGELERERGERWQSAWRPQLTVVDSGNPYRVNLVGAQELNRVIGGVPQRETRQIMFSLKVIPDRDAGRASHNLHTGFLVLDILDVKDVNNSSVEESLLPRQAPSR